MRRLSVRLPDPAHARLEQHAHQSGLPIARAATALLCTALEPANPPPGTPTDRTPRRLPTQRPTAKPTTERPTLPHRSTPDAANGPPWLPCDTDPHWPENTWGAILALHRRYPDALAKLEHDWHEHPERVEVLAALATWRAGIDAAAEDPREELSFHNALQQLARTLNHASSLGSPFDPATPIPPSWRSHAK